VTDSGSSGHDASARGGFKRDLTPLFEPRSLAVVGASANTEKWGYWFARDAAKGAHRRRVYLVGRSGGEVHGLAVHRSLGDLPEAPELVVLAVPGGGLEDAVDEAIAAGARALVAIAAGFGELSSEGAVRERRIAERVRAAGAVLVGPNCLGIFDGPSELELATADFPAGPLGFLSQSGNVGLETALLLEDVGLGYSRFVSVGNQADVDVTELIPALAQHEPTKVIGIYCEDFRDGRAFAEAARTAGKPVVLLTVGRTEAAVRAARSHTGALTSALDAVDAACRAAGIHRVDTPRELVDVAQALLSPQRPRGRRVGIISDGGGYGAIAADRLGALGLQLPVLAAETQERLRSVLPPTAATANPVDLAGGGEQDTFTFSRSTAELLASDDVDAVVLTAYYGGYSSQSDDLREREVTVARQLAAAVSATGKPLVVHAMHWDSPPARELRAARIPVYRAIESAVLGLAALVADTERPGRPVPTLPPAAEPVTDVGYAAARAALTEAGIAFVPARAAQDRAEALAAAEALGYPVVLKAVGALHKSDAGGVVVGIRNREELAPSLDRLAPPYSVERVEDVGTGFELLIGARRDPRFGAVVVAAAGGVNAEILRDTAAALAPVSPEEAMGLIRSLRCAALLDGARCRPRLDLAAAADALSALSRFAAEHLEVVEVEINPLLVRSDGAVGLDARILLA
jgi:acyl-CoA synthetase (NDP forming)